MRWPLFVVSVLRAGSTRDAHQCPVDNSFLAITGFTPIDSVVEKPYSSFTSDRVEEESKDAHSVTAQSFVEVNQSDFARLEFETTASEATAQKKYDAFTEANATDEQHTTATVALVPYPYESDGASSWTLFKQGAYCDDFVQESCLCVNCQGEYAIIPFKDRSYWGEWIPWKPHWGEWIPWKRWCTLEGDIQSRVSMPRLSQHGQCAFYPHLDFFLSDRTKKAIDDLLNKAIRLPFASQEVMTDAFCGDFVQESCFCITCPKGESTVFYSDNTTCESWERVTQACEEVLKREALIFFFTGEDWRKVIDTLFGYVVKKLKNQEKNEI